MQLNTIAVHDLVLAVLPGMIERKAGGILISGSAAGNSPIPYNATYAATKAFVNTFSESLRGELRKSGVHVTLLAPGPVRTDLPEPSEASIVEKLVPDFLWISTEYTAKKSLDALARNKMRVVPGVTSKAMSVASQYAPRAIVAPIVGSFYKKWAAELSTPAIAAAGEEALRAFDDEVSELSAIQELPKPARLLRGCGRGL